MTMVNLSQVVQWRRRSLHASKNGAICGSWLSRLNMENSNIKGSAVSPFPRTVFMTRFLVVSRDATAAARARLSFAVLNQTDGVS